jgi:hypothetical protein
VQEYKNGQQVETIGLPHCLTGSLFQFLFFIILNPSSQLVQALAWGRKGRKGIGYQILTATWRLEAGWAGWAGWLVHERCDVTECVRVRHVALPRHGKVQGQV